MTRQLLDAPSLLEVLFDEKSRPSLRWLRTQQRAKIIPSVTIGRLIFFDEERVRESLEKKRTTKARA